MKDLALLVADKNMDYALRGILSRRESIGIRDISYEIKMHAGRDGGVRTSGPETLALLRSQFQYGLIMLDWEGSGSEHATSLELENDLDQRLVQVWGSQAKALVIHPELDIWVWGSDNAMKQSLDWSENQSIRKYLLGMDYAFDSNNKPVRPKEALEEILRHICEPRSSSLYQKLTSRLSLTRCVDPAFVRLRSTLQMWFS